MIRYKTPLDASVFLSWRSMTSAGHPRASHAQRGRHSPRLLLTLFSSALSSKRISLGLAANAARQRRLHDDKSRTCLAQRNLSVRPEAMFLKVGGVDYIDRCAFPTGELLLHFASATDSWSQHVKRFVALRATHLLSCFGRQDWLVRRHDASDL